MNQEHVITEIQSRIELLLHKMKDIPTDSEEAAGLKVFLSDRTEILSALNLFLTEALESYVQTDQKIEEMINHESIIWPKTEFGTNIFEQLKELEKLICLNKKQ